MHYFSQAALISCSEQAVVVVCKGACEFLLNKLEMQQCILEDSKQLLYS